MRIQIERMNEKLILFDVDGILTVPYAISYDYWRATVKNNFGIDVSNKDVYMEGKTDMEILKDLLELKGIKNPLSDKRFMKALNDVGIIARKAIGDRKIDKVPNVEEFIKRLIKEGYVIGLLTGNTTEKTKAKLQSCNLWKYFKFGAYGDVTIRRSELVSIAMDEAKKKTGKEFSKENVFVIGDTVRDIRCAKEGGVKSIAVATGTEPFEMLKKEKPDFLFKDFTNIEKIIEEIK
jgi:phosphoglycolate phosphatase-like HAD superfamily hydrolase